MSSGAVVFHRRAFQGLALSFLVLLNLAPSLQQVAQRTVQLEAPWMGVLFPGTFDWLRRQPELAFSSADTRMAMWLEPQVRAGDKILSSGRDENLYNVYPEATFSGLSGALPIGHAYPSTFEGLGTLPFRQKAVARAFWLTRDPKLLANLEPDWLVLRPPFVGTLEGLPGLELVRTEEDRSLYRVDAPKLPAEVSVVGLSLKSAAFPSHRLDVETACIVPLTLGYSADAAWQGTTRLVYEFVDLESGEVVEAWDRFAQPLELHLKPGESTTVSTTLVTPHGQGRYRLVARIGGQALEVSPEISVGHRDLVSGLRIVAVKALDPVTPGQVTRFSIRLQNPAKEKLVTSRPLLVAIAAKSETSLHLMRDFQELALDIPAGGEKEVVVPAVVPENPNGFELTLIPRDGWVVMDLPALSE